MGRPTRHVTRCVVAGIVALLPLGGGIVSFLWLESAISSGWKDKLPFYFPGLGILLATIVVYATGLLITTFVGRWLWRGVDHLLESLPLLGTLYHSLKEVLGYDSSRERFFQAVVAVPRDGGHELGFVTGECSGPLGAPCLLVFVPGSPNPTNGRLILVPAAGVHRLETRVSDALRTLVSMGKSPLAAPQATGS